MNLSAEFKIGFNETTQFCVIFQIQKFGGRSSVEVADQVFSTLGSQVNQKKVPQRQTDRVCQ